MTNVTGPAPVVSDDMTPVYPANLARQACLSASISRVIVTLSPTTSRRFRVAVDVDPEVFAVQHNRRGEPGDLTMAHAGIDAAELEVEADRLGDTLEGEVAIERVVIAGLPNARRGEGRRGVLLDVEEVSGLDVRVALLIAGIDGIDGNLRGHRRRAVVSDHDGAAERVEVASHLAHHEVTDRELDRRVNGVDGPCTRGERLVVVAVVI